MYHSTYHSIIVEPLDMVINIQHPLQDRWTKNTITAQHNHSPAHPRKIHLVLKDDSFFYITAEFKAPIWSAYDNLTNPRCMILLFFLCREIFNFVLLGLSVAHTVCMYGYV